MDRTPNSTPEIRARCLTRSASRRAARCRFYRNGDKFFAGYTLPVSVDRYGTLENLYKELTGFLGCPTLPSGVRQIFDVNGRQIHDLHQICQGGNFVAAGNENFKVCSYVLIQGTASPVKKQRARSLFKSESFTTPSPVALKQNDFIRARNIIVLEHGNRPRKVVRVLLNKKTVHSMGGVFDMISETIGFAVQKLVSVPNGLAIHRLQDLFDSYYIFIALQNTKTKITPKDLQLHMEEIKMLPLNRYTSQLKRPISARSRAQSSRNLESISQNSSLKRSPSVNCMWPKIVNSNLVIGERLGDGHFAEVRMAVERKTGTDVAVKIIDRHKVKTSEMINSEIEIMKRVAHPNIVKFIDHIRTPNSIFIILELVRGGDLFDTITESDYYCSEQACLFTYNLAGALHYLHSFRIIHRDIKPENLLVFKYGDGSKRLKLCDFGLATERKPNEKLDFVCGTATYVAPEMIRGTGYAEGIDVWALGVISYILLCGFPPFRSESGERDELFADILSGDLEFPSPYWDEVGPQAEDLIIQILNRDEDCRISAGQVLLHPWLNNPNNNFHQDLTPKQNRKGALLNHAHSMSSLHESPHHDNEVLL